MRRYRLLQNIYSYLQASYQWYLQIPDRKLDEAYRAVLLIKAMEDEHFNGQQIVSESANYTNKAMTSFQRKLKKYLKIVRRRLTEFSVSNSLISWSNLSVLKMSIDNANNSDKVIFTVKAKNSLSLNIQKLKLIDDVLSSYTFSDLSSYISPDKVNPSFLVKNSQQVEASKSSSHINSTNSVKSFKASENELAETDSLTKETHILPRSIVNTINRIRTELDPRSEQEVIKRFQDSQKKTVIATRTILLLIITPLLTYQVSKYFVVEPLVTHFGSAANAMVTFLNFDMEKEALEELQTFKVKLNFQNLLGNVPKFSTEEIQKQLKEKAQEIAEEYRGRSDNAIANIFTDLLSLAAFGWVVYVSKREIAILKSFIDDIVYGLSDSAKAFIIILFTDMFVGFHSPWGWKTLLSGTLRHFGLQENNNFINLFIATFPVILDTVFKYCIFRYLNRVSPSAVVTYRSMQGVE